MLHTYYIGELVLDGKDLNLLIKRHRINTLDSDTFLVVKLVFEVLNVKVLQLRRHCLDLLEKFLIFIVNYNLLPVNHIIQVKLGDFFESERMHTH